MKDFVIEKNKVRVSLPYHPDAPGKFHALGGEWDGSAWRFDLGEAKEVAALKLDAIKNVIREIYGYDVDAERATVKITVKEDVYAGKRPYVVGGKALAIARGRDSGARVGEGVTLLQGKIYSGGSVKNWSSEIAAGSVFLVEDFPLGADLGEDADAIEIEIVKRKEKADLPDVVVVVNGGVAEVFAREGIEAVVVDFDNLDEEGAQEAARLVEAARAEYGKKRVA